jgi:Secretion system C-terminal sorting domain
MKDYILYVWELNRGMLFLNINVFFISVSMAQPTISGTFDNVIPGIPYTYTIESSPCATYTWLVTFGSKNYNNETATSVEVVWDATVPQAIISYTRYGDSGGTCDNYSENKDVTIDQNAILNNDICCNENKSSAFTPQPITQTSGTSLSGGDGTYTYQWQYLIVGVWSNISGATSASYSPPAISSSTSYRRIVNSGTHTNTSDQIDKSIHPILASNNCPLSIDDLGKEQICGDQDLGCTYLPSYIESAPSRFCYDDYWESSTDGVNFTEIPGTLNSSYITPPGPPTRTSYYRKRFDYNPGLFCWKKSHTDYSNTVTVTVFKDNENLCGDFTGNTTLKTYLNLYAGGTCTTTIENTANVKTRSGGQITLSPGFKTVTGAVYVGEIGAPCQSGTWRKAAESSTINMGSNIIQNVNTDTIIKAIDIYPNPTDGNLNIQFGYKDEKHVEVFIYNNLGEMVYSKNLGTVTNTKSEINLDNEPEGLYIVKIIAEGEVTHQSIILAR